MTSSNRTALVFGATSAIATAFCRLLAIRGYRLCLVGRNETALDALAADLQVRGAEQVTTRYADLGEVEAHPALVADAWTALGTVELAVLAYGSLSRQRECELDWQLQSGEINTNLVSQQSLLTHLANQFESQGHGCLAAITSVAGERGRASNYVYGASKAGLSCYLEGLGQRLHAAGVRVLDLRPGWVDTPMTAGFDKGALWSTPERVARGMLRASRKSSGTVYLPGWWRPLMAVFRSLPGAVVRRLGV